MLPHRLRLSVARLSANSASAAGHVTSFFSSCSRPRRYRHHRQQQQQQQRRGLAALAEESADEFEAMSEEIRVAGQTARTVPMERIRNFSIIAHIDHGKSTLADRMLQATGNLSYKQQQVDQVLDQLEVERERGITVKAQTASSLYRHVEGDGQVYLLNLIDTPGHVDFSYEVSRSFSACQGALLLVDSSQGVQAQTIATYDMAREAGLEIVPVLTKIDMDHADPEAVKEELMGVFEIDPDDVLECSAKSGLGIHEIFPAIVERVPPPVAVSDPILEPFPQLPDFRALLFDSWFDVHRGVICLISIVQGELRAGDRIGIYHSGGVYDAQEVGIVTPTMQSTGVLRAGEVGYVVTGMRSVRDARLGDTFFKIGRGSGHSQVGSLLQKKDATDANNKSSSKVTTAGASGPAGGGGKGKMAFMTTKQYVTPLPGFRAAKSMVFAGIYPSADSSFDELSEAMDKLTLNDASVQVARENSTALGLGFRCGFLGVLHMDVFRQRLEQEHGASVVVTAPTVPYKAVMRSGEEVDIQGPAEFPDPTRIKSASEPLVRVNIMCPTEYLGVMLDMLDKRDGKQEDMTYVTTDRVMLKYLMPMAEVVADFYNQVKTSTSGFASLDYEEAGYREAPLVLMEIRVNGEPVDALSVICHKDKAQGIGRSLAGRLKQKIKRHQFEVVIQAAVGQKILARERIPPFRKDVLSRSGKTVGGGDMSRKRKLLEKQKAGKRRMKSIGNVDVPQSAFLSVISPT